jgi:hypothetical protein
MTEKYFKKMVCRNTCEEIIVEDDIFEMSGTMGTSHKPEIKIIVKPKHWENSVVLQVNDTNIIRY